jgi:hypothetical protein
MKNDLEKAKGEMMETELTKNEGMNELATMGVQALAAPLSGLVEAEKSRAVQEIQAAYVIAKKFPRDINAVYTRIMESCKRKVLAEQAMYSFPRGGQVVTGPSIRMAEVLAQNYGNLDFGVREIERRGNVSVAESYCLDLETNTRQTKVFEVPHEIELKGGRKKKLTDPRDIYELVANNGARRLRACILGIIPGDIVEAAVDQCRKTVAKGSGEPMVDRIRKMVAVFKEMGVSQEMVAEKLGHSVDLITAEEIVELTAIYTSIRDKQAKRGDFFNFKDEDGLQDAKASALSEKLKEQPK